MFSRIHIFSLWCSEKGTSFEKTQNIIKFVQHGIANKNFTADLNEIKKCISYICKKITEFMGKYRRNKSFVAKYQLNWLNTKEHQILRWNQLVFLKKTLRVMIVGDRKLIFSKCSKRTKRRRIANITKLDETAASVLRSSDSQPQIVHSMPNVEEVLSLFVETNLTKHQYLLIRSFINSKADFDFLPSYEKILLAKTQSYPHDIKISESKAEVELQSLLNHTDYCSFRKKLSNKSKMIQWRNSF